MAAKGGRAGSLKACNSLVARYEKENGHGAIFPCEEPSPVCPYWVDDEDISTLVGEPLLCDVQVPDVLFLQGDNGFINLGRDEASKGSYLCDILGEDALTGISFTKAEVCFDDLLRLAGDTCGKG